MAKTLEEVIYQCRWVDGIKKDPSMVSDAALAKAIEEAGWVRKPDVITFNDIRLGDTLRVTFPPRGGMSDNWELAHSREGMAYYLDDPEMGFASWMTADRQNLVSRDHYPVVIELIERLDATP